MPAIYFVGYGEHAEAGCPSTKNLNNRCHICRKSKILSHCDAMVQIERKFSAFFRVRKLNQNALGWLTSDDDIVIRRTAVNSLPHQQSLPGSNVERNALPRLSERCPRQD